MVYFQWPPFLMGSVILVILQVMKQVGNAKKELQFLRAAAPLTGIVISTTLAKVFHPPSISLIITTFSIVDNMKEHFQVLQSKLETKDNWRVKELFDDMEKLRQQFESIARPTLEIEAPSPKSSASTPKSPKPFSSIDAPTESSTPTQKPELSNPPEAPPTTTAGSSQEFNPEAEIAELESEFGKVARITLQMRLMDGNSTNSRKNCSSSK